MLIILMQGCLQLSCALFLIATACLPAEFFSLNAIGLTWTLDRFWLIAILGQFALKWYRSELAEFRLDATDLLLILFVMWLTVRTFTQPLGVTIAGQPPTLMHYINGYLVPLVLYIVLRFSKVDMKQLQWAVASIVALGAYLSVTAIFEVAHLWQFVFPKFIADPLIGIHFGRARGPMLQSVRLGMCLLLAFTVLMVFTVWLRPKSKPLWLTCAILAPLFLLAILLTYTRSIWMGAALVVGLLVFACLRGVARKSAIVGIVGIAALMVAIKGPDLVSFKREYSAAETRESTYMRASFAYVSWKMFEDRPLAGFGFNQFQIYNRPYLADRSTDLRLESIRGYVHHNSFLSLLVDLGLIGFALYMAVYFAFARQMVGLWRSAQSPRWAQGVGITSVAIIGVHALQMAFHEVSFSAIENTMLFCAWGMTAACHHQYLTPVLGRETHTAFRCPPKVPGTIRTAATGL